MNATIMTSLDEIAKYEPCGEGWRALLKLRGHAPCGVEEFTGDATLFPTSSISELGRLDWLLWTSRIYKGDDTRLFPYRLSYYYTALRTLCNVKNDADLSFLKDILVSVKGFFLGFVSLKDLEYYTHVSDFLSSIAKPDSVSSSAFFAVSQACYAAACEYGSDEKCKFRCCYADDAEQDIMDRLSKELDKMEGMKK